MSNQNKNQAAKQISNYVYHTGEELPEDAMVLRTFKNRSNGFYSEAVYVDGEIVIVYRGTDTKKGVKEAFKDVKDDIKLWRNLTPSQLQDAREVCKYIKQTYPEYKISLTGHSLGGKLAAEVGKETGLETTTFGTFGDYPNRSDSQRNYPNITNYGNPNDPFFNYNLNGLAGKTFYTKEESDNIPRLEKPGKVKLEGIKNHYIENLGDIEDTIEYKKRRHA